MRFGGEPLGLDAQGLESGAGGMFARPHELAIVPSTGEHRLRGVVKRIHGIGPARRVEIALGGGDSADTDRGGRRRWARRDNNWWACRPEQYRLFADRT